MNKSYPNIYLIPPVLQLAILASKLLGFDLTARFGLSVFISMWLISLIALVFYVRHVQRNGGLNRSGKRHWMMLLFVGGLTGELFYWFKHIRQPALS